jgi:branched-chain amino acid transport system permease protein
MTAGVQERIVPRVVRATRSSRIAAVAGLAAVVALASLPAWAGPGTQKLLVEFFTLLALAQMWNLMAGFAGLVSIGQQAFIGLGAYAAFVALDRLGMPPLPVLAIVAAVALAISLVTSAFVFRLAGGYFAIGMWVVAEVFRILVTNTRELGAGTGVSIRSLNAMPPADRQALVYWLALVIGAGSILLVVLIMRSRIGLALRAVRDGASAARSLGVDVGRAKLAIFLVAAIGMALAGAVTYMQLLRIQPTAAFGVDWTAKIIFIVVIGGLGRIEGPIVGAVLFFLLREVLADQGSLYLVILGITAISVTLVAPNGLWGMVLHRFPIALFGIERRLVFEAVEPSAPVTTKAQAGEGQ